MRPIQADYFLQHGVDVLPRYSKKLDDELTEGMGLFDEFSNLYNKALTRSDSIAATLLKSPIDFSANESITVSR
jgi:hypothetical protein